MMKYYRSILPSVMFLPILIVTAHAHQTQQTPAGAFSLNFEGSRVAIIFTDFFYDPRSGINRILSALNRLDQELQPRKAELQRLRQRIEQATKETGNLGPGITPTIGPAKLEELERLKIDLQRKAEDIQTDYRKRRNEILNPIFEDLDNAIKSFARHRGITLILDGSKMDDAILHMSEEVDLTRPFITEFNRGNAATVSPASKIIRDNFRLLVRRQSHNGPTSQRLDR